MIDLDVLIPEKTEGAEKFAVLLTEYAENNRLYVELAVRLCRGTLLYTDFMRAARWLGCYNYILPDQREILPELSDWLYSRNRYNLFSLALLVSHLAANLSLEQQVLLLRRLEHG